MKEVELIVGAYSANVFYGLLMSYTGFDVGDLSEDAPDDLEGLDAAAAHVANLLSNEPADSKFLACIWYYVTCYILSRKCYEFGIVYVLYL